MLTGLPPIKGDHPRLLILGSMPSVQSLKTGQYYAHPRNAFWPLMARLNHFQQDSDYRINVEHIRRSGIVIWDVIAKCVREGSLDSAISLNSIALNPVVDLINHLPGIERVGLNGKMAEQLFYRHCFKAIKDKDRLKIYALPSTSPANTRLDFEAKVKAWGPLFASI